MDTTGDLRGYRIIYVSNSQTEVSCPSLLTSSSSLRPRRSKVRSGNLRRGKSKKCAGSAGSREGRSFFFFSVENERR